MIFQTFLLRFSVSATHGRSHECPCRPAHASFRMHGFFACLLADLRQPFCFCFVCSLRRPPEVLAPRPWDRHRRGEMLVWRSPCRVESVNAAATAVLSTAVLLDPIILRTVSTFQSGDPVGVQLNTETDWPPARGHAAVRADGSRGVQDHGTAPDRASSCRSQRVF